MRKIIVFAVLAIILSINASAFAYLNVINLQTLPCTVESCAYSVNDNGQIVGSSDHVRATLFDSSGSLFNNAFLGTGATFSINNSGQAVGSNGHNGLLYDMSGQGNNTILISPDGTRSQISSINNKGQAAGLNFDSVNGTKVCVFDTAGGNIINTGIEGRFGDFLDSGWGEYGINDNGLLVGQTLEGRAFLYDTAGQGNITYLGTAGGKPYSINNENQIVGWAYDSSNNGRACIFDSSGEGENIYLGSGWAALINDKGQIVGTLYENNISHACLFDSTGNGNNIDLNTLIDPACGWTLTNAFDINNNGWIVGQGFYYDELGTKQTRAFLLVIPEPISLLMLGFGAAMLKRKH